MNNDAEEIHGMVQIYFSTTSNLTICNFFFPRYRNHRHSQLEQLLLKIMLVRHSPTTQQDEKRQKEGKECFRFAEQDNGWNIISKKKKLYEEYREREKEK